MSSSKLTIMFVPLDAYGPINASTGLAEVLLQRGHRIVFAVAPGWKNKLSPLGFEEEIYDLNNNQQTTEAKSSQNLRDLVIKSAAIMPKSSFEKLDGFIKEGIQDLLKTTKETEPHLKEIVKRIKPNVIIIDNIFYQPSLQNVGIPWVWIFSSNPIVTNPINVPPMCSGYPTNDRTNWNAFREEMERVLGKDLEEFNKWLHERNQRPMTKLWLPMFMEPSPYLNLYMIPEELDYTDLRPALPKWFRCDGLVRTNEGSFTLPTKLLNKPGKLIYLSMGSLGCTEVSLMKRLVAILAKSPHRFIVCKGPFADEYDLPENMWGESFLPQTAVLPLVDLVITHGGNNTVTESFHFGKPMIVMPLFYDQYDNAQRLKEKGLGIRLNPYFCTEEELLGAIQRLLADTHLIEKFKTISTRIQTSNSRVKAAQLVEQLA